MPPPMCLSIKGVKVGKGHNSDKIVYCSQDFIMSHRLTMLELKKEHNSGVTSLAEKKWNKIEAQGPRLSRLRTRLVCITRIVTSSRQFQWDTHTFTYYERKRVVHRLSANSTPAYFHPSGSYRNETQEHKYEGNGIAWSFVWGSGFST